MKKILQKKFNKSLAILLFTLSIIAISTGLLSLPSTNFDASSTFSERTNFLSPSTAIAATPTNLKVHFIDVGQADCILIQDTSGETMLIDAGNNEDSTLVTDYISNLGITKIDILIGTHPHEDHIGGLDAVINKYDIGKIYMPQVSSTTQTYIDVLNAIKNKGYSITTPVSGTALTLGNSTFKILSPISSSYSDLNNYSIAIKYVYQNNSFLFMGDAEQLVENEILSRGFDIKSDLLKVGHHGSASSTSATFLNAVLPKFAVISVSKDNSYGHPSISTLTNLYNKNVNVYRTDAVGTIIATSDGTNITLNKSPSPLTFIAPPNFKAASSGYRSIKTSWSAVTGASGYKVYRATSSTGTYSLIGTTTATNYNNTGLTTNKTYYYKAKAYRTVGTTTKYSSYSSMVSAKPIPSTPTLVKAVTASPTSIKTSWGAVSGASGYRIYRATSSAGTYSMVKATTSTSWTNGSLTTGKTYYYKVRAYKTVGTTNVYSKYSSIVSSKPVTSVTPVTTTVYRTTSGTKYHLGSCSYLSSSKIAISLSSAKSAGYTACSVCKPPQ